MSNARSKILHCGHFKFNRLLDTADRIVWGELLQCSGAVVNGWFRGSSIWRSDKEPSRLTLQIHKDVQFLIDRFDFIFVLVLVSFLLSCI